jgi:hypothetical protein
LVDHTVAQGAVALDVRATHFDGQGRGRGFAEHILGSLEYPSGAAHDLFGDADKCLILWGLLGLART